MTETTNPTLPEFILIRLEELEAQRAATNTAFQERAAAIEGSFEEVSEDVEPSVNLIDVEGANAPQRLAKFSQTAKVVVNEADASLAVEGIVLPSSALGSTIVVSGFDGGLTQGFFVDVDGNFVSSTSWVNTVPFNQKHKKAAVPNDPTIHAVNINIRRSPEPQTYNIQLEVAADGLPTAYQPYQPPSPTSLRLKESSLPLGFSSSPAADVSKVSWIKGTDELRVYALNGGKTKWNEFVFSANASDQNYDGFTITEWTAGQMTDGVYAKDYDITALSEISTAIRTQQAVDETEDGGSASNDLFISGGNFHGDEQIQNLSFIANNLLYTFADLPATGTSDTFEVIERAQATNENSTVVAFDSVTTYVIEHGGWTKTDPFYARSSNTILSAYLAMCPVVIAGVTDFIMDGVPYDAVNYDGNESVSGAYLPKIEFFGSVGRVSFEALECSHPITPRVIRATTNIKGYMDLDVGAVINGDTMYLKTRYRHFG